jgi:DNA-binding MarR family transcriptional regulator
MAGLAKELGLDRSTLSRHTARLEQSGFVQRSTDPYDHRARVIEITHAGILELKNVDRAITDQIDLRLATWEGAEAAHLAEQLEQLLNDFRGKWSFPVEAAASSSVA